MPSNYTPLRIDFDIITPVRVPGHLFHLDGLIGWSMIEQRMRSGDNSMSPDEICKSLPIESIDLGDGEKLYKASAFVFTGSGDRQNLKLTRPCDYQQMALDQGEVFSGTRLKKWDPIVSSGFYKAYFLDEPLRLYDRASAWVVGDKEQITQALSLVENIGKLTRLDCGHVSSLTVTEDEKAFDLWRYRALNEKQEGYHAVYETVTLPYYDKSKRIEAWIPSKKVEFSVIDYAFS